MASLQAQAQPADYVSAQALEAVPADQVTLSHEFLYRVQLDSAMRFYKPRMTDGLYRTKNAFLWPDQIKVADRAKLPVFGSTEILLNEKLVLADAAALFFRADTGLVSLEAIPLPGIVMLRASTDAVYQEMDRHGIQPERPLPTALYTFRDSTKICLIRSAGLIPKEYDPYTPERTYRIDEVVLDSFPRFSLLPHFLNDGMENASADSASMLALDRKIKELEANVQSDSTLVAEYLANLRNQYPQALPMRPYEDSTDYYSRVRIRDVEALGLSSVAYGLMGFRKAMIPLRERIFQLKEVQSALAKDAAFEQDPRTAFLRKRVWNCVFLSVQGILARNLPDWTTDPGPTDLWGIAGRLQWEHRLFHRLGWTLHATGGMSSWKYHDLVTKESVERWGGGGAGIAVPLLILPRTFVWKAELGGLALYRTSDIVNADGHDKRWGTSPGFYVGTAFLFTPLPVQMDIRYQYTADGFGDLFLGVALPLPFIGGAP